eukprot:TRINITY_DN2869_c0_g1_i2.p1 TRINITY_DN2869_c0_g1~~TRINITY_DN2869_c0_g1_i2.p1  ORF type:complete len:211 (+),score=29.41 TRINITY_DN2869_c0_g1_i2:56-634(+)
MIDRFAAPSPLLPPFYSQKSFIEYSVHQIKNRRFFQEICKVFPEENLNIETLLIIPTWQPAQVDLAGVGPEIEEEKDRLLENFFRWGNELRDLIQSKGFWADYTDPATGLPVHSSRGNLYYNDLEGISHLSPNFPRVWFGDCALLSHPTWGTAAYPATFFSSCPLTLMKEILSGLDQGQENKSEAKLEGGNN